VIGDLGAVRDKVNATFGLTKDGAIHEEGFFDKIAYITS
jgi:hypothetical protein